MNYFNVRRLLIFHSGEYLPSTTSF